MTASASGTHQQLIMQNFIVAAQLLLSVVNPSVPPGHEDYCTYANPCSIGQGDCDHHWQCQPGLVCGSENGLPTSVDVCVPANVCGNRVREPGEQCDDGNQTNGDLCERDCTKPRCGNGILDSGEICDDGNQTSGDGCDAGCSGPATCGDGELTPGEECEDEWFTPDPPDDGDGCSANCQIEYTIAVIIESRDGDDFAGVQICPLVMTRSPYCENFACDEYTTCRRVVGKNTDVTIWSWSPGPSWDWSGHTCNGNFPFECTTYFGAYPEEVEIAAWDLQGPGPYEFRSDWIYNPCAHESGCDCGNGVIDGPEVCDDGNLVDGDGCSDSCAIEEAP
jgi:cysteine-rich repeat protein